MTQVWTVQISTGQPSKQSSAVLSGLHWEHSTSRAVWPQDQVKCRPSRCSVKQASHPPFQACQRLVISLKTPRILFTIMSNANSEATVSSNGSVEVGRAEEDEDAGRETGSPGQLSGSSLSSAEQKPSKGKRDSRAPRRANLDDTDGLSSGNDLAERECEGRGGRRAFTCSSHNGKDSAIETTESKRWDTSHNSMQRALSVPHVDLLPKGTGPKKFKRRWREKIFYVVFTIATELPDSTFGFYDLKLDSRTSNISTGIDIGPNISQLILALDWSAYQQISPVIALLQGPKLLVIFPR